MIACERGSIDYDACGDGPTIVLVPGSCSTGAAWRPVMSELALQWELMRDNRFRCVTTSLLGYGGTAERRTLMDADISHEADIIEAVIRRAGCPVHLVGHSFGGLASLAVALRKSVPLLSLRIIEAPAAGLLWSQGEYAPYDAFRTMTDRYIGAVHAGEKAAIGSMIDFYGGAGTFAAWPQRVRDHAIATTPINLLDWASAYAFQPPRDALASIEVPTLIVWGGASHPSVQRANALLAQCVPKAAVAIIAGAAHFMIATHAANVARVIAPAYCGEREQSDARMNSAHPRDERRSLVAAAVTT